MSLPRYTGQTRMLLMAVLDNAEKMKWSVQGFGMLRLYIRSIGRLHIWDSALRYPNVSMIHTHSWDLASTILAGTIRNTRYIEWKGGIESWRGEKYWKQRLLTGYNSHMVNEPMLVTLSSDTAEIYHAYDNYHQAASEIHLTDADDGTVTLMARKEDVDGHADVYWPEHCTWGTAIPRRATQAEIKSTVAKALTMLERES